MKISKPIFAIARSASKEDSRYALSAINVERFAPDSSFGIAAATDGKQMVVAKFHSGEWISDEHGGLIDAQIWRMAEKMAAPSTPRGKDHATDVTINGAVTVRAGNQVATAQPCEGRFPNWRDVIPREPITARICVDAKLLGELLLTIDKMSGSDESRGVIVSLRGESKALTVERVGADGTAIVGVAMPLSERVSDDKKPKPLGNPAMIAMGLMAAPDDDELAKLCKEQEERANVQPDEMEEAPIETRCEDYWNWQEAKRRANAALVASNGTDKDKKLIAETVAMSVAAYEQYQRTKKTEPATEYDPKEYGHETGYDDSRAYAEWLEKHTSR